MSDDLKTPTQRVSEHSNTCDLVGFRQGYNAPPVCSCGLDQTAPRLITVQVCGGAQARICPKTGKAHDMSAVVRFKDGGSIACKDCGVTAMQMDMMELP